MLLPSQDAMDRLRELVARVPTTAAERAASAEKLLTVDPTYTAAYLSLAIERTAEGRFQEAEDLLWKGMLYRPLHFACYLNLAELRREQNPHDALPDHLVMTVLRHLASSPEIPKIAEEHFRAFLHDDSLNFADPDTYEVLLFDLESKERPEPAPADAERFLPFRVLAKLHWSGYQGDFPDELTEEFAAHREACVEVCTWALRSWARYKDPMDDDALNAMVAMLGEFADASLIEDLWAMPLEDQVYFNHLQWALCRLDERFPAEALAYLRQHATAASVPLRCAFSDHLNTMPRRPELGAALSELLNGFESLGGESDAGYLLAAVSEGLADLGDPDQAAAEMEKYKPLLSADNRKLLDDLSGSNEGFVPNLLRMNLKEPRLEQVLSGALDGDKGFEDESLEDDDFEDDGLEDEEEWDEEDLEDDLDWEPVQQVIAPVRPGRNESCWCGSGKKYKKCHLEDDERKARGE